MKNILLLLGFLLFIGLISCKEEKSALSENKKSIEHTISTLDTQVSQSDTMERTNVDQDTPEPNQTTPIKTTEDKELKDQATQIQPREEIIQKGKITFKERTYDFGRLRYGKIVTRKFIFTNTGKAPLNIKRVTASCGCTVASYPFIPIAAGEEGVIEVEFNSKGKMGMQRQSVSVITDGIPSKTSLMVKGLVVPMEDEDSSS